VGQKQFMFANSRIWLPLRGPHSRDLWKALVCLLQRHVVRLSVRH